MKRIFLCVMVALGAFLIVDISSIVSAVKTDKRKNAATRDVREAR